MLLRLCMLHAMVLLFAFWNPTLDCLRKQRSPQPMLREVAIGVVWKVTVHGHRGRLSNECMMHGAPYGSTSIAAWSPIVSGQRWRTPDLNGAWQWLTV
jgi:hypothetical protein